MTTKTDIDKLAEAIAAGYGQLVSQVPGANIMLGGALQVEDLFSSWDFLDIEMTYHFWETENGSYAKEIEVVDGKQKLTGNTYKRRSDGDWQVTAHAAHSGNHMASSRIQKSLKDQYESYLLKGIVE